MNIDNITIGRIVTMHPKLKDSLLAQYREVVALLPKHKMLRFAFCYRSIEEQDALYAQGRTKFFDENGKRLNIVTNARGGQSYHNFGLAFDVVMLIDKDGNGTFETADWSIDKDMKIVINYFKSKGWEWGGDWKTLKDTPHFQMSFGKSTKSLFENCKINKVKYPLL